MTKKRFSFPLIRMIEIFCSAIAVITFMACNTNKNSIPVTNLQVLYEQDAVTHGALQKTGWSDITCPSDIENYSELKDPYNCVCMQKQGWEKIDRLTDIELQAPSVNNVNYFWIRGEFYINEVPEQYQGVYLENVQGRDVIYINNRLVGIKNVDNYINYKKPSHYRIPPGILKKGKNNIITRLEIWSTENNGVRTGLFIQHQSDYMQTEFWHSFFHKQLPDVLFCIFCAFLLYSLTQIVLDNDKMIHIVSSLSVIYYIVIILFASIPFQYLNVLYLYRLIYSLNFGFAIIFIFYFQSLYGIKLPVVKKYLVPLMIILALLFSFTDMYFSPKGQWILSVPILMICYYFVLYILFKLHRLKPDIKKFITLFCIFAIFITFTLLDIISFIIELSYWPEYTDKYLYTVTLIILPLYGVVNNAYAKRKTRLHLEQLYSQFIKQENRRPDGISITDLSEEKINHVINFINQNYKENLSRKDLAAIIDMNPSHFSSVFNSYTGKKIQEYINTLRIQEAAKLLKETDRKIIDIAFSVGFENLSTFIRIFKNEMGRTPSDYREDITIQQGASIFTAESIAE